MSKLSKPIKESNKCFNLRAPLGACNKRTKKIRAPEPLRKDQLAGTAHALTFADVFTAYFFDDIEFFFKKKYPNQMKEMDSNGKKNEENSRKKKRKSIEVSASDLAVDVARLLNVSFVGVDWENPPDGVKSMVDDLGGDQSRLLERCKAYSCRFCVAFGEGSTVNRQIFSSNRTAHMEANHPGILKELSLHLSCGKDLDVLTSEMVKHIELCEEQLSKSSNNYFSSLSVPLGAKHLTNDIRRLRADVISHGKLLKFLSGIEKGYSFHSMYANNEFEKLHLASQRLDSSSLLSCYEIYNMYLPLSINFLYLTFLEHKPKIKTFSFSVDSATDLQHRKFHSVTLRYINPDFQMVVLNCGLYESTGSDAETLRDFYTSLFESFFLSSAATCAAFVTDNAANMVKSVRLLNSMAGDDGEDDALGCFAHLLNLVIQDMFGGDLVKKIVDCCIKCDEYLRKSGVRDDYAVMRAEDGIPNVVGFSKTRFGGCIYVIKRLFDTYFTAGTMLAGSELTLPNMDDLKVILEFSHHIVNDIDGFGAMYTVSVSYIPNYVLQLYQKTVPFSNDSIILKEMKKLLKLSLDRRLLKPVFKSRSKYIHAAFLDPRYYGDLENALESLNNIQGWNGSRRKTTVYLDNLIVHPSRPVDVNTIVKLSYGDYYRTFLNHSCEDAVYFNKDASGSCPFTVEKIRNDFKYSHRAIMGGVVWSESWERLVWRCISSEMAQLQCGCQGFRGTSGPF